MAVDSAIPEHWTVLNASREEYRRCREDIESLKHKCNPPCEDVKACPKCCSAILDRIHDRYRATQKQEWFSQRTAFLMTLEGMFAEAKERKLDLRVIEAAIESEKEAWYRLVLRRHPEFVSVSDRDGDQDAVKSILDDPDRSREELISTVWGAVGEPADRSSHVDSFAAKVAATNNDPAKLKELYISEFFKDADGNVLEHAQPYLTMFESDPGMKMEDVVGRIITLKKESKHLQVERDKAQSEMAAVRRAKTAFEQDKAEAKGQLRDAQPQTVGEKLYGLPPCEVCRREVDGEYVISCPLCQALCQMGNEGALVVYCSEACYNRGEGEHMEQKHYCSAGDDCVREMSSDYDMMGDDRQQQRQQQQHTLACNECLAQKQATLFCSPQCAQKNLWKHRQEKHEVKIDHAQEIEGMVSDLGKVLDDILRRENPGLEFNWMEEEEKHRVFIQE